MFTKHKKTLSVFVSCMFEWEHVVGKNTLKGAKEFGGVKRREGGDGGGGVCVGGWRWGDQS